MIPYNLIVADLSIRYRNTFALLHINGRTYAGTIINFTNERVQDTILVVFALEGDGGGDTYSLDEVSLSVGLRGLGYVNVPAKPLSTVVAINKVAARQWRRGYSDTSVVIKTLQAKELEALGCYIPYNDRYEAAMANVYYTAEEALQQIKDCTAMAVAVSKYLAFAVFWGNLHVAVLYKGDTVGRVIDGTIHLAEANAAYKEHIAAITKLNVEVMDDEAEAA